MTPPPRRTRPILAAVMGITPVEPVRGREPLEAPLEPDNPVSPDGAEEDPEGADELAGMTVKATSASLCEVRPVNTTSCWPSPRFMGTVNVAEVDPLAAAVVVPSFW